MDSGHTRRGLSGCGNTKRRHTRRRHTRRGRLLRDCRRLVRCWGSNYSGGINLVESDKNLLKFLNPILHVVLCCQDKRAPLNLLGPVQNIPVLGALSAILSDVGLERMRKMAPIMSEYQSLVQFADFLANHNHVRIGKVIHLRSKRKKMSKGKGAEK